jgi:AraC family transcriptional regulator
LALERLAAEAGVHPVHLSRTFRRFRGRTLGDYLQELRVRHVCQGLADADRPLVDLSLDAGFTDQSHCTRVFKRLTGMTPGVFRASLRCNAQLKRN